MTDQIICDNCLSNQEADRKECPKCGFRSISSVAEWRERVDELWKSGVPFKPFEKRLCVVSGEQKELCPVSGLSIDRMASLIRRGSLKVDLGWGLIPAAGFETRFHSKRVSNVTFRTLPPGFTSGNMLVCFSDDELWMKNLDCLSGDIEFSGKRQPVRNLWRGFLNDSIQNIEPVYSPPREDEDEWYSFTAEARINGRWFSVRPPTAAGCVIDVPNYSGEEAAAELPCEIPVTFRDFDYLRTQNLLSGVVGPPMPADEKFSWLSEKFFGSHGKPTAVSRLIEQGAGLPAEIFRSYVEAGHGYLGMLKGEQERFGVSVSIPQLELRDVAWRGAD